MESLVTDQPWTDSMLNVTKLALFFTYNLITEAARPKGVIKCSEEGTWESLFFFYKKGSGLLSSRLLLDWLRVDRKSGIFPFFIPIGFRWSKLPLFVRKERIQDVFVECAAICLYLHLAKSVHSSPFVIEFLLYVFPPTPNWFIDSGFWARINWKTQTPVLSPVTTLFPLMTSPH